MESVLLCGVESAMQHSRGARGGSTSCDADVPATVPNLNGTDLDRNVRFTNCQLIRAAEWSAWPVLDPLCGAWGHGLAWKDCTLR
jgi:hypothetical protein